MDEERTCGKCGSTRTQVTGRSVSPPVFYLQCQDCGRITTVIAANASADNTDARRVERLVRSVIADFNLPFELLNVTDGAGSCEVIVRAESRRLVRFHVKPAGLGVMRAAIKQRLEADK